MDRRRPGGDADEWTLLTGWLDWQRQTVHLKCEGLTDVDAHRLWLPASPKMTIAGLVGHLTWVEQVWLEGSFLGDVELLSRDPESGWGVTGHMLADLLGVYGAQCDRSRRILADHQLHELEAYAPPGLELLSLRWIATHLIEETGRHLGHLDVLREMTDGSRGQ